VDFDHLGEGAEPFRNREILRPGAELCIVVHRSLAVSWGAKGLLPPGDRGGDAAAGEGCECSVRFHLDQVDSPASRKAPRFSAILLQLLPVPPQCRYNRTYGRRDRKALPNPELKRQANVSPTRC